MEKLVRFPIELLPKQNIPYFLLYNFLFKRIWKLDVEEIEVTEGDSSYDQHLSIFAIQGPYEFWSEIYIDISESESREDSILQIESINIKSATYTEDEGDTIADLKETMPDIIPVIEALCVVNVLDQDLAEKDSSGTPVRKIKREYPWDPSGFIFPLPLMAFKTIGPHFPLLFSTAPGEFYKSKEM